MSKHIIELLDNTFNLIVLLTVITVSTAGVLAFNPRSALETNSSNSVKGISTFDLDSSQTTRAVTYKEAIGIMNGIELQNYEKQDGGYLSRIIVTQIQSISVDQSLVNITNNSNIPRSFKLIFRADPIIFQNHLLIAKFDNIYVPVQINNYGYFETTFSIGGYETELIGIGVSSFNGNVNNIGIEMEIEEL